MAEYKSDSAFELNSTKVETETPAAAQQLDFEDTYRDCGPSAITDELRGAALDDMKKCNKLHAYTVYDSKLLAAAIDCGLLPLPDVLQSMVARCIERQLEPSLDVLLKTIAGPMTKDRRLYLRWVGSADLLVRASQSGWRDLEFEKRITLMQRLCRRRRRLGSTTSENKDAKCEADDLHTCLIRWESELLRAFSGPGIADARYFGQRLCWYSIRWNRRRRHRLLADFARYGRVGDCAWQTYVDKLLEFEFNMP